MCQEPRGGGPAHSKYNKERGNVEGVCVLGGGRGGGQALKMRENLKKFF